MKKFIPTTILTLLVSISAYSQTNPPPPAPAPPPSLTPPPPPPATTITVALTDKLGQMNFVTSRNCNCSNISR
jgi:hypothetical protein